MLPEIERLGAVLVATSNTHWNRIGAYIDPDALTSKDAARVLRLSQDHAKTHGRGPGSMVVLFQRAMVEVAENRMRQRDFDRFVTWVDDTVEMLANDSVEGIAAAFAEAVMKRETGESVRELARSWGKEKKLERAIGKVQRAQKIGKADASLGALTREARKQAIRDAKDIVPLTTGYGALDAALQGGPNRRKVSIAIGSSGDMKSMTLSSFCAAATAAGRFAACASNELEEYEHSARYDAALFGVRINDCKADEDFCDPYYEEFEDRIGPYAVRFWDTPAGERMTPAEVEEWLVELQKVFGRPVEMLAIDYLGRMAPSDPEHRKKSGYSMGEIVMDELADLAKRRNLWLWTADATVRDKSGPFWTKNDIADSIHKTRRADCIITLNRSTSREGRDQMTVLVDKVRDKPPGGIIGPYPTMGHLGRIMPGCLLDPEDEYRDL